MSLRSLQLLPYIISEVLPDVEEVFARLLGLVREIGLLIIVLVGVGLREVLARGRNIGLGRGQLRLVASGGALVRGRRVFIAVVSSHTLSFN
jgi:hypothetical protein